MMNEIQYNERRQVLDLTLGLYERLGKLYKRAASRNKSIELTILILSVLTSGGLYLLLSGEYPKVFTWIGAVISTLNTALTIYLYSKNFTQVKQEAFKTLEEISIFIARLRAAQNLDREEVWNTYKKYETAVMRIENS